MRQVRSLLLVWLFALPAWAQSLQETLEPSNDANVNWSCTGADCSTGHYAAVNDDDEADYVWMDGSPGTIELWDTTDNAFGGTISYVRLRIRGRRVDGGATGTCRIWDGANWCGTLAIPGDPAWSTGTADYSNDCGAGAWEDSELDAIQIECQNGANNKNIQVAWADAEIWGTVPSAGQPFWKRWHSIPFGPGR